MFRKAEKKAADKALATALMVLLGLVTKAVEDWDGKSSLGQHLADYFHQNQKKVAVAGTGVGAATGALGAIAMWESSLGFWGGIAATLGLVTVPAWVPIAGTVAGAAGGLLLAKQLIERARARSALTPAQLDAFVDASRALVGDSKVPGLDAIIHPIIAIDSDKAASERRKTSLRAGLTVAGGAASIAALSLGRPEALALVGKAYVAVRTAMEASGPVSEDQVAGLASRATELATALGFGKEAEGMFAPLGDQAKAFTASVIAKQS